ncbi:hypothetical protein [uncultured Bradyrhizobium sp.]|uniref:hypothetical protein n=1 Tax=Bradyrhizobium sp. TaxID=376 RepID=UPI002627BF92|nr:hypothetical protein [uncultured Bradyrhizobium sp.]
MLELDTSIRSADRSNVGSCDDLSLQFPIPNPAGYNGRARSPRGFIKKQSRGHQMVHPSAQNHVACSYARGLEKSIQIVTPPPGSAGSKIGPGDT